MGKKKSNKNNIGKFMRRNRGILGIVAGAVAGIAISGLLRSEKVQHWLSKAESVFSDWDAKPLKEANKNSYKTSKTESEELNQA